MRKFTRHAPIAIVPRDPSRAPGPTALFRPKILFPPPAATVSPVAPPARSPNHRAIEHPNL